MRSRLAKDDRIDSSLPWKKQLELLNAWAAFNKKRPRNTKTYAVDNGDGTGSLKGKLVGMGL
jgi:hypothetical protein